MSMFYSEQLLSREGPLAYVWLAANVEKKLTKQQLLSTSITESTRAIETSSAPSNNEAESQNHKIEVEPLALRLTGQLLYGVVRIYSRKTKYLYDDVTDALLKLKSSFKTSQSVILPPESTVITSMKNVILQDTVTEADLLYQEPLNFEELLNSQHPSVNPFQSQFSNMEEDTSLIDHSIEVPRGQEIDELEGVDDDLELNLDFDLDGENLKAAGDSTAGQNDESIEVGRAGGDDASQVDNFDFGYDLDLPDFDEPQLQSDFQSISEAAGEQHEEEINEPQTPDATTVSEIQHINEPIRQKRPRKKVTFENQDVVRTLRKRIIVDEHVGIPGDKMRENQNSYPSHITVLSVALDQQQQLDLIQKLSQPSIARFLDFNLHAYKRRRLHTATETEQLPEANESDVGPAQDYDNYGYESNYDFEQPEVNYDENGKPTGEERAENEEAINLPEEELLPEFDEEMESFENRRAATDSATLGAEAATTKATIQIASQLRSSIQKSSSELTENRVLTFTEVMEKDLRSEQPLSKNPKREATRAFFELLVLATADTVNLKQDRLFGEVEITTKGSLMAKFL